MQLSGRELASCAVPRDKPGQTKRHRELKQSSDVTRGCWGNGRGSWIVFLEAGLHNVTHASPAGSDCLVDSVEPFRGVEAAN